MRGAELQHGATLPVVGIVKLAQGSFQMLSHRAARHAGPVNLISAAGRDEHHVGVDLNFDAINEGDSIRHCEPSVSYETRQYRSAANVNLNSLRNDVKWIVTASDGRA